MALKQLSEEQVRTWTRTQKDEWWFHNVFRGDMPQLTIRSGITGFLLGGVLAATALYIAAKTGISIGVGVAIGLVPVARSCRTRTVVVTTFHALAVVALLVPLVIGTEWWRWSALNAVSGGLAVGTAIGLAINVGTPRAVTYLYWA